MRISSWIRGVIPGGRGRCVACCLITGLACSSGAWAQEAPAQQQSGGKDSDQLQQVVVTGSHISNNFNSPTPVTTIDASTIQSLGLVSIDEVMDQIPQNSNFTSSANVGLGNFNVGAQFGNLRGLNPFFGTRTLTLVDSERVVPTSSGGAVDLNIVPSLLISRVDVVTGGASAAYGSDAVAGVINVLLDKNFEGFKLQLDGGETTHGDGGDLHAGLKYGRAFLDGKLHELFGAEYEDSQEIGLCGEVRSWCAQGWTEYTNSGYTANGLPHYIIGPGATEYQPTTGALYLPTGIQQFNAAGTALEPFSPGNYGTGAPFSATQNGSGPNIYDGVTIRPPVSHWSLYNHNSLEVSSNLEASLDVSFGQRRASNLQEDTAVYGPPFGAPTIYPNNPFLPASVAALIPASGASFMDYVGAQAPGTNSSTSNTGRVVLSLKGGIAGSWNWDAYYEWGETGVSQRLAGDEVSEYLDFALDAVAGPNGPVCAATVPGNPAYTPAAAGCVPLNLFGSGNASPAAIDYAFRTLHEDSAFTQQVVSANADGNLFDGFGAGPVKAAVGVEYRHSMASVTHDLADQPWYSGYELSYGSDYSGNIDVLEGYGEVKAPLLKDLPLAKNLDLDIAVRETRNQSDDSSTGVSMDNNFPTWKASLNYAPTDWINFRIDRSRDTRAPSFYEMWALTVDNGGIFGSFANPWKNPPGTPLYGVPTDSVQYTGGGYNANVGLRPEEADTTTAGIVLTPTGRLDGLRFSADWYQILLDGAISELGGANIVTACYNGQTYYCQFIQGTSNGSGGFSQITAVDNPNLNLGQYTTRGVDFEGGYHLPLDHLFSGRSDSLNLRVLATYTYQQIINPGDGLPVFNYAGQTGPVAAFGDFNAMPHWQGNATLSYTNGPFDAALTVRVIGSGSYGMMDGNTGLPLLGPGQAGYSPSYVSSISNNSVASATYFNLALNYTLPFFNQNGHSLTVFGSVTNLFDRDPPVAPGGNGYPTNPVYFDTFGRTFRLGLRLQL